MRQSPCTILLSQGANLGSKLYQTRKTISDAQVNIIIDSGRIPGRCLYHVNGRHTKVSVYISDD